MSDPFAPTPDNPTGAWEVPFQSATGDATIEGVPVDSVSIVASVGQTALGPLPVLILTFRTSGVPLEEQLAPTLLFMAPPEVMRAAARMFTEAATTAADGAERMAASDG